MPAVTGKPKGGGDEIAPPVDDPLTHSDADRMAEEAGIEWPEKPNEGPEGRLTLREKVHVLNGGELDFTK